MLLRRSVARILQDHTKIFISYMKSTQSLSGRHDELMVKNGVYADLVRAQEIEKAEAEDTDEEIGESATLYK